MENRKTMKAQMLAKEQNQLAEHDEVRKIVRQQLMEHLEGEGFWDDFKDGFMSVIKPVASVVKNVSSIIPHPMAQGVSGVLGALGAGRGAGYGAGNAMALKQSQFAKEHKKLIAKLKKHRDLSPEALTQIHELQSAVKGSGLEGSGVISSLGIPIVSNLAGLFGLGHEEGGHVLLSRTQKPRPASGAGLEGSGVISDLGIPIVSNLAGIFGLGHEGKPKKKRVWQRSRQSGKAVFAAASARGERVSYIVCPCSRRRSSRRSSRCRQGEPLDAD